MIVKQISLENFKNITDFSMEFSGGVYLVTGRNEIGKTTLINAVVSLLTGERSSVILQNGKENGFAKMVIGDDEKEYTIEYRMTESNPKGYLTITDKDGLSSNTISALQKMFGYVNFDAYDFVNMSNSAEGRRKQVEFVRQLLPVDARKKLLEIDEKLIEKDEERKGHNLIIRNLTEKLKGVPEDLKDYGKPIDVKDLYEEKSEAEKLNNQIQIAKSRVSGYEEMIVNHDRTVRNHKTQLEQALKAKEEQRLSLKAQFESQMKELELSEKKLIDDNVTALEELEAEKSKAVVSLKRANDWLKDTSPVVISVIDEKIANADSHNEHARKYQDVLNNANAKTAAEKDHAKVKAQIEQLLRDKKNIIKESNLPVDGLTFTDDGLFLNGIPFKHGEVSTSQEMEVATKIMIALNPKINVFRIAQGESLDSRKLKDIVDFAKKNKLQGFIEQVERDQDELMVYKYEEKNK